MANPQPTHIHFCIDSASVLAEVIKKIPSIRSVDLSALTKVFAYLHIGLDDGVDAVAPHVFTSHNFILTHHIDRGQQMVAWKATKHDYTEVDFISLFVCDVDTLPSAVDVLIYRDGIFPLTVADILTALKDTLHNQSLQYKFENDETPGRHGLKHCPWLFTSTP